MEPITLSLKCLNTLLEIIKTERDPDKQLTRSLTSLNEELSYWEDKEKELSSNISNLAATSGSLDLDITKTLVYRNEVVKNIEYIKTVIARMKDIK